MMQACTTNPNSRANVVGARFQQQLLSVRRVRQLTKRRSAIAALSPDDVTAVAKMTFEPRVDGQVLASQLAVIGSSAVLGGYWWFVLVPSERASLAKQKRKGGVGEYLKDMNSDPDRKLEQWFYADWIRSSWFQAMSARSAKQAAATSASSTSTSTSASSTSKSATSTSAEEGVRSTTPEQSNAADPLSGPASNNLFEPSYSTPTPKFWSLDNPIVAAMVLILAVGFVTTVVNFELALVKTPALLG